MTLRIFMSPMPKVLAFALVASLSLAPVPILAASPDVAVQVSEQLRAQGYAEITVHRTLLGKIVVTARGHGHLREIVIDPRNGALLRDLVRAEDGGSRRTSIATVGDRNDDDKDDDKSGSGDGDDDSGGGSGGGDDDDSGGGGDDDDSGGGDDDDSGSDDSGSGDNSGSGSDDSGDDSGDDDSGDDDNSGSDDSGSDDDD